MLDSLKLGYQDIGRGIIAVLPTGWQRAYVLFEAEGSDVASYVAFFLDLDPHGAYASFRLPRPTYLKFMDMWERSGPEAGAQWSSMTFIVHRQGTFDVEYSYEVLGNDEVARKRAWMLRHGIVA